MVFLPVPVVELMAHFLAYVVRIIEFQPRRRGNFLKCAGSLSLIGFPLCAWASVAAEWPWAVPAFAYFTLICVCGALLEKIETQDCLLELAAVNDDDYRDANVRYIDEESRTVVQLRNRR